MDTSIPTCAERNCLKIPEWAEHHETKQYWVCDEHKKIRDTEKLQYTPFGIKQ